jgi:hypothetical protein
MKIRTFGRRRNENPDGSRLMNLCHGGVRFSVKEKETELYGNIHKSRHFPLIQLPPASAGGSGIHLFFSGLQPNLLSVCIDEYGNWAKKKAGALSSPGLNPGQLKRM